MLLISGATAALKLVTDAAVTVDTYVSFSKTDTTGTASTDVGYQASAINSATTTPICAAAGANKTINISSVSIRNKSASSSVTVTVNVDDGTVFELFSTHLGPGASLQYTSITGWFVTTPSAVNRPWFGKLAGCYGSGDPGEMMEMVQRAGVVAPTPTNISTSVARCSAFMLPFDLTVNRIRAYGIASTTTTYRVALYRMSDLARLMSETAFSTSANTWVSIGSALNVQLSKDVMYFIACSVNATGTTAGAIAFGGTTTSTTGQVNTAPGSLPGNMQLGSNNYLSHFQFQFAVTTGALPNPAATLAAPAAWTGGMPAFWLDNQDV